MLNKRILAALVAVPVVVAALAACEEKPAEVKDKDNASEVVKDEPAPENDVVVEEPETEEQSTATLGDKVNLGDWDVTVTEVALNANQTILNPDFYNEKPKGQYVLVTYDATYHGAARTADVWSDLYWSLTTTDQKIWESAYATTPADSEDWTSEARKGGTVKQQVVFDVNPKLLKGGILSVEGYDEDFDSIYADFIL